MAMLVYGTSSFSSITKIDQMVKRLIKIISFKTKYESIRDFREKNRMYLASELHIYELFKLLLKIFNVKLRRWKIVLAIKIDQSYVIAAIQLSTLTKQHSLIITYRKGYANKPIVWQSLIHFFSTIWKKSTRKMTLIDSRIIFWTVTF